MAYVSFLLLAAAFGQPVLCSQHQTFLSSKVLPVDAFKLRNSLYVTVYTLPITDCQSSLMKNDHLFSKKCVHPHKHQSTLSCTKMFPACERWQNTEESRPADPAE